ncbi:MAG TPA: ABC transporter permease [Candidatus Bathyarchaeota archaeon]|nr:ABC transporter permease [Candidatus Bathyarchaeota archaeon]
MMGLRAVLAIAERDVKSTLKDKMALFWLIAFPILLLTMSFLIWANPPPPIALDVGVVYEDTTMEGAVFTAENVTDIMREVELETEDGQKVKVFNVVEYGNDTKAALEDLRRGQLDAVVVFPDGFSANVSSGFTARVEIYVLGGDAYREQTAKAILTEFFKRLSDEMSAIRIDYVEDYMPPDAPPMVMEWMKGLVWPLNATVSTVVPEAIATRAGIRGWFSVAMAGVGILMCGLSIGATMVVEEREKKTLRRLMAAPISPWDLLAGKTLSGLLWLGVTTVVSILYGLAWGARIAWDPLNPAHLLVPVVLAMGGLMMLGLGLLISMVAKTAKGASGLATAIGWPLMFLTGIWLPAWLLPEPLRAFATYFPLGMAIEAVRQVLVFGAGLEAVLPVLPWLAGFTALFYGLGALAYRVVLRRSL